MRPKRKFRSIPRKKKKFRGNQYQKKGKNVETDTSRKEDSAEESGNSSSDAEHVETDKAKTFQSLPASVRKMKAESSDLCEQSGEEELENVNGFRFMDIAILAAVIESLRCPLCKQGHIVFEEDQKSKMGLASLFILKSTTRKCSFCKSF